MQLTAKKKDTCCWKRNCAMSPKNLGQHIKRRNGPEAEGRGRKKKRRKA